MGSNWFLSGRFTWGFRSLALELFRLDHLQVRSMILLDHPVATPANVGAKRFQIEARLTVVLATNHFDAKVLRV